MRLDVRALRGRRARTVATVTRHVAHGPASITLTGRFRDGGRTIVLHPGRYQLSIRATDPAGNTSRRHGVGFRLLH